MSSTKNLSIQQLDNRLAAMPPPEGLSPPAGGWVRAIRRALGVTNRQLAKRVGRDTNTVSDLQAREAAGTIQLSSLRELARAVDCELVYALVPRKPLGQILDDRAHLIARQALRRTGHSMELERQALGKRELERATEREVKRLLAGSRRKLWE